MNTAVVYSTKTGNSKKIAQSIAETLQIKIADIRSNPALDTLDLLFIVSGIYGGKSSPELKAFAEQLTPQKVKKAILITSCLSKQQKQDEIREILINNKVELVPEEFLCRGMFFGLGYPKKEDIDAAVAFAQRLVSENS